MAEISIHTTNQGGPPIIIHVQAQDARYTSTHLTSQQTRNFCHEYSRGSFLGLNKLNTPPLSEAPDHFIKHTPLLAPVILLNTHPRPRYYFIRHTFPLPFPSDYHHSEMILRNYDLIQKIRMLGD